jgi:hypothetical protein
MKKYLEFCLQTESFLTKEIIIKLFEMAAAQETIESLKGYRDEDIKYCLDLLFNKFRALNATTSGINLSLEHFKELYEEYNRYPEKYIKWYEEG